MENQNSVCFVGRVNEIIPIEGADNIELLEVSGWNCVSKKGAHTVGELITVATVDAVIPEDMSERLGVTGYLRKGSRVRTVKLKGVFSECLLIPLSETKLTCYEGKDLQDDLGIFKYEPPVKTVQLESGKKIKIRENSNFHTYYKFPNIKNVKGIFTEEDYVQITRKLHGTNSRYGIVKKNSLTLKDKIMKFFRLADKWVEYEFVYGSHHLQKGSDSNGFYSTDVWREIADRYKIKQKLWKYIKEWYEPSEAGTGLIIYGEIYGAGIQKNYDYGLKQIEFAAFDIEADNTYLPPSTTEAFIETEFGLPHAEVLYYGKWSQAIQDSFVDNNFIPGTKIPHEGIVIKHESGDRSKVAKVINPSYLIYAEKKDVGDLH